MLFTRAEEFVYLDDVRVVDLIHQEDLLPQCKVAFLCDLWAVLFNLPLGDDLGREYSLYLVLILFGTPPATGFLRVDIVRCKLVLAALILVLEDCLEDSSLPALADLL